MTETKCTHIIRFTGQDKPQSNEDRTAFIKRRSEQNQETDKVFRGRMLQEFGHDLSIGPIADYLGMAGVGATGEQIETIKSWSDIVDRVFENKSYTLAS